MITHAFRGTVCAAFAAAVVAVVCAVAGTAVVGVAPAFGAECGSCSAWWELTPGGLPTDLQPGKAGEVSLIADDLGDLRPHGTVVLSAKLPAGLTATGVRLGISHVFQGAERAFGEFLCVVQPREVRCTLEEFVLEILETSYTSLSPYVEVQVSESAKTGEDVTWEVSGGGAPAASVVVPIAVSGAPTPFGVERYELKAENADGSPDMQAGSHPFALTTVIGLNQSPKILEPPAAVKDLRFNLPPGLIGNPLPFPQCPLSKFLSILTQPPASNDCPSDTAVGVASVTVGTSGAPYTFTVPLFALVPTTGEPARFGFFVTNVPVYLDTSVRTGSDYGVTVSVDNITELANFISSRVTFWGVPGDPRHDSVRGWDCLEPNAGAPPCTATEQHNPPPLLTLPTSCTGPVRTTVDADSWEQEGAFTPPFPYVFKDNLGRAVGVDGCNQLPFSPEVRVTPDGRAGSTPTGLTVTEHIPQETSLNAEGLAESAVKGLTVTLPKGVVLNPSAADGLEACSMEAIGIQSYAAPSCPEASKVATVTVRTPLLANPLLGAAYLAAQDANPFGSLVALYLYAEDPVSGVRAKAAGEVLEDPVTGQLTAHFEGDPVFQHDPRYAGEPEADFLPEAPFEDVELHFFGGDRAPLGTPAGCGAYRTTASFTPWSEASTVESSSEFDIVSGPNGSPCANPLPFAPSLTAGTTSIQAGGFSPFTMTMSREDGQQNLQGVQLKMPLGMSGTLSSVKLCDEADANAGTCGPESQIGETIVSVGLGGDPFSVRGGKVYITGPYRGAPFGLSIVNPAKAGPFDLGKVVVRAKIDVNQETAALTITTDNEGPYKIPTIIDGIPLQIKHINVNINRPNFTFNATNCSPLQITGSLLSTEGTTSSISLPYQVTNCAVLAFKPKLQASVSGRTTRANGATFTVKLGYEAGPYDANIAKVKVELPKAMPSRLSTLQKACLASVFETNPAACPAASIVGHAKASTPVLPVPLEGPAYFVSHGGEAFPSLIIVLQGYGVTVHLIGSTFIDKHTGVTSSTFKTVPDVPVGSFELTLPQGPYSALTANTNLCTTKLQMPTEFTGQNGALIKTSTKITPTGCSKAKAKARHKHRVKRRHRTKHKPRGAKG